MALILDIETAPQARALLAPYPEDERPHPSNYKDPEKIAAWHLKDEADWREGRAKECSLSPRLGRIVAIGMCLGTDARVAAALNADDEAKIVRDAVQGIHTQRKIATFNGLTFDLPFLHVRAAVLGVPIPYDVSSMLRRYSVDPHVDVRAVLTNWDSRTTGTLTEWCDAFGIPCTDSMTGADVNLMVEAGDEEGIRMHCLHDLELTAQLYNKLSAAWLV